MNPHHQHVISSKGIGFFENRLAVAECSLTSARKAGREAKRLGRKLLTELAIGPAAAEWASSTRHDRETGTTVAVKILRPDTFNHLLAPRVRSSGAR
jgi:hypothetical protein